jgi:16S rRNA G966 N2-methylase RsmD
LQEESYRQALGSERARLVFTDPPYNVPIEGHVSGLGLVSHKEFAMASGEMSSVEFRAFLEQSLGLASRHSLDGAIHYVCMDWRHMSELLAAGSGVYSELKNLCVWNKTNGGMGSLYRSKHELVFVFKSGKVPHVNNVALGKHGRYRSNVWDYAGQNSLSGGSKGKLSLHPTVKPVAMVADAIRDCSERGALVVDPFGGSGTTLIAADRAGRRAALIEFEPRYVDVIVRRWQNLTGRRAIHGDTFDTFGESRHSRRGMENPL